MIAKIWKKLLFFILIIACIFNIMSKIMNKVTFTEDIKKSDDYIKTINTVNKSINNTTNKTNVSNNENTQNNVNQTNSSNTSFLDWF